MYRRIAGLVLLGSAAVGLAQPAGPVQVEVQAPLLFVRVSGPKGGSATFLEGRERGRTFELPVAVGLRPGYIHRLRLDGLPAYPGIALYASLEVTGTLCLPPRQKASDFPAPVVLSDEDIAQAIGGTFVTKVIVLEDPAKALPGPRGADEPAEMTITPNRDPELFAKQLGRTVLIVRLGRREPEPQESARLCPGLILYPGQHALPPTAHPVGPFARLHYPRPEHPEECLRDGGDAGVPVHFFPGRTLAGVDPADTVADYIDSRGTRRLAVTNMICLCVPRFVVVRHLLPPTIHESVSELAAVDGLTAQERLLALRKTARARQVEEPDLLRGRQRPNADIVVTPPAGVMNVQLLHGYHMDIGQATMLATDRVHTLDAERKAKLARQVQLAIRLSRIESPDGVGGLLGTKAFGMIEGLGAVAATVETREVVYICKPGEPELPDQPLQVLKWASTDQAQIGDVVTFFIRYRNVGGKPIQDLAITDSLTGRLEYVPGSAKSDHETIFVTQANEAGSLTLRWEVRQPLERGESGVVSFQARIR